jgi:hypothetical protein
MSDYQTIWTILCRRALSGPNPDQPFEISEVVPDVAKALQVTNPQAERMVAMLLGELDRLPDGRQFFTREGDAVVPLSEFAAVTADATAELAAYPFEL